MDQEILLQGYRTMLKTRYVEERMLTLQRQGIISFAMSSKGEEACAVASAAALDLEDWMYPQYRELGVLFWRGFSIQDFIHQMFGDAKDLILGRQMPNHFGSRALNIVQVSSPIGTKIPHAAGCAFAMKFKQKKSIAIAYFGEGATSEGDFHAGMNFAAVTKAPVLFFCRNNGYAISTPSKLQFATEGVAIRGEAYGMPAYVIDGNDFFAVFESVSKAKQQMLQEPGPIFIEAMTYRLGAHSTSDDPSLYRSQREVSCWEEKCPILRLYSYLVQKGLWDENKEKEYLQELAEEVTQAVEVAKNTPLPPLESMIEHVYASCPNELKRQLSWLS